MCINVNFADSVPSHWMILKKIFLRTTDFGVLTVMDSINLTIKGLLRLATDYSLKRLLNQTIPLYVNLVLLKQMFPCFDIPEENPDCLVLYMKTADLNICKISLNRLPVELP